MLGDVRLFFAIIDKALYSMISGMYNIIMYLSSYSFEGVEGFRDRIYALVGVFMLFKISFSFIQFIVNPDSFFDKSKGFQKIIVNIILVFVMLGITPWAFEMLRTVQKEIIDDNVLGRFFLGSDPSSVTVTDNEGKTSFASVYELDEEICPEYRNLEQVIVHNPGDYIALTIFTPFYGFNYDQRGGDYDISKIEKEFDKKLDGVCDENTVSGLLKFKYLSAEGGLVDNDFLFNEPFFMEYKMVLSTLVGIVTLLFLISIGFDIAIRAFKLYFLEMFAPIPIISYIEPDASKSKMFNSWIKMVGSTWISLFIRLAALFMSVYIISNIDLGSRPDNIKFFTWMLIKLFITIGALMFAKQVPNLIEQLIPGLKLDGLELNPMKKIRNEALGGNFAAGAITGGVAGGLAALGGGAANIMASRQNIKKFKDEHAGASTLDALKKGESGFKGAKNVFKGTVGTVAGGAGSSFARAVWNSKDGKFTPFKNAGSAITSSSTARNRRDAGYGFSDYIVDKATDIAKISNDYGTTSDQKKEIKKLQQQLADVNAKEQQYLQQQALLAQSNSKKSTSYNDAVSFEWEYDDVTKKQYRKYKYENWNDYNTKYSQDIAELVSNGETVRADIMRQAKLTEEEFTRAMMLEDSRRKFDDKGRELERDIKKREENLTTKKD